MTRPGGVTQIAALCLAVAGCDGDGAPAPSAPTSRTDAVGGSAAPRPSASASAAKTAPRRTTPRSLCADAKDRDAPPVVADARAASGASAPPPMAFGKGRWTWLNVWAAWCEPCKEELPMLLRWRDKLASEGVALDLAFVSIDDDERELDRFLASQPASGMRASYWLPESKSEDWFRKLGFAGTPTLPVHALVSPDGKLTCAFDGALEEVDWPPFSKLVRR
jgi:thiol-disulfide isomerase/thioredoxin